MAIDVKNSFVPFVVSFSFLHCDFNRVFLILNLGVLSFLRLATVA
jgi:hypothetical protein